MALLTFSEEAAKRFGAGAAGSAELQTALQKAVDEVNGKLAPYERVKRFCILPQDLTEAAGELTPKLSVKRKVVIEKYRGMIEALYARGSAPHSD